MKKLFSHLSLPGSRNLLPPQINFMVWHIRAKVQGWFVQLNRDHIVLDKYNILHMF